MAKVKNTGRQPRGFFDDKGNNVVIPPGGEATFPMTDAYYAKLEEILARCDPKPYELSGGGGGKSPPPPLPKSPEAVKPPEMAKSPEKQPEAKKG